MNEQKEIMGNSKRENDREKTFYPEKFNFLLGADDIDGENTIMEIIEKLRGDVKNIKDLEEAEYLLVMTKRLCEITYGETYGASRHEQHSAYDVCKLFIKPKIEQRIVELTDSKEKLLEIINNKETGTMAKSFAIKKIIEKSNNFDDLYQMAQISEGLSVKDQIRNIDIRDFALEKILKLPILTREQAQKAGDLSKPESEIEETFYKLAEALK